MAVHVPTIITNEFRTSKVSPINFELLKNVTTTASKTGDRLRQCTTDSEAPNALSLSENAQKIAEKQRDRDSLGSVAICQKGIYKLLGKPIPYYERNSEIKNKASPSP